MTQKTTRNFEVENCSKPPKKKNTTNKTDVYHIYEIWSSDISGSKDYGPEIKRR